MFFIVLVATSVSKWKIKEMSDSLNHGQLKPQHYNLGNELWFVCTECNCILKLTIRAGDHSRIIIEIWNIPCRFKIFPNGQKYEKYKLSTKSNRLNEFNKLLQRFKATGFNPRPRCRSAILLFSLAYLQRRDLCRYNRNNLYPLYR